MSELWEVVVSCNDKDTADIVKAEIRHRLDYHSTIRKVNPDARPE